ncbi:MAG: DNA polymerase III subunit delta [Prevotellaceae bacterium]|jgi:DNA polymerase-3 subunit delta|nr:DNA polymerase III subunit delta [Prevotellaceae bacterium]
MAKIENKFTFDTVLSDLRQKKYYPIYFLMGEEPFFIDKISDYIEQNVLSEEEKDMNLKVLYGKDTKVEQVIMEAKQFPFMADYRVVILKEAQNLDRSEKQLDKLEFYTKNIPKNTILVICYKFKTADKRKKYIKDVENNGVLFNSTTLYDNQVPTWIVNYCKNVSLQIDAKAAKMLAEHIGNDLSRITTEIDKLLILLPKNTKTITFEIIEKNVGVSKSFNNFELTNALGQKNILLANRIVAYFGQNPKDFAITLTLATMFNYFVNLLHYQLLEDKSQANAATVLGINPYFVSGYATAARFYPTPKLREIIHQIRIADARSKGFGVVSPTSEYILKELVFRILH